MLCLGFLFFCYFDLIRFALKAGDQALKQKVQIPKYKAPCVSSMFSRGFVLPTFIRIDKTVVQALAPVELMMTS